MLREYSKSLLTSKWVARMIAGADRSALPHAMLRQLSFPRVAFDTLEDAWRAAASVSYAGHDTESIAVHRDLRHRLRPSDPAVLKWLNQLALSGSLRILDFGGNVGNLYYSYRPHLPPSVHLEWHVIDLSPVIAAGKQLAEESKAAELHFESSFADLSGSFDLLLASGSLHYWEGSIASWLRALPHFPTHIVVNRSPVHESHSTFITVQQTNTYAVPCIVRNRSEMVADFWQQGYRLIDEWEAPELSLTFTFFPALSVPRYSGFYFRKV